MAIDNVDGGVMMTTITNNNTKQSTNKKRVIVIILTNCILLEASYNGGTFSSEINIYLLKIVLSRTRLLYIPTKIKQYNIIHPHLTLLYIRME